MTSDKVKKFVTNNGIILLLAVLVIYVGITVPTFRSIKNLSNLAINAAPRVIIALGVSGCLITKGTDLSAGRAVGLAGCLAGMMLQNPEASKRLLPNFPQLPVIVVLLIVMVVCALFGLLNAIVISYLQVPAFICTLGTQLIIYGVALVITGAQPIGSYRQDYINFCQGKLFGVPYLFIYLVIAAAIFWFIYNYTRHGKYMYAIGGNEAAAEVSGVNVKKVKTIIYVTAGAMYAIAGFLLGGKSGGTSVNLGQGYELEAIAACTIGGVSVNGGIGKVSGCIIGVAVFELLKSALQFLGVNTNYQYIAQGVVIVIAIALDIRKYIVKK
ncbi:MAG: beta-methylgalactoside transporter [Lachnospiraceae bacterium]|nr:beta-methylgalactoside transporter [Robinsoniella sp.]MDY3765236.1 beta-methylgalactoside transporter [Lachnospiraceae bacterium]